MAYNRCRRERGTRCLSMPCLFIPLLCLVQRGPHCTRKQCCPIHHYRSHPPCIRLCFLGPSMHQCPNSITDPYAHARRLLMLGVRILFLTHTLTLTSPTALVARRIDDSHWPDFYESRLIGLCTRSFTNPWSCGVLHTARNQGVSAHLVAPLISDV
jgi:hypothetical protein